MKQKFSERLGITKPRNLQINRIDQPTRNRIWNSYRDWLEELSSYSALDQQEAKQNLYSICCEIADEHYKQDTDTITDPWSYLDRELKTVILSADWYEVFNLLEYSLNKFQVGQLPQKINGLMKEELINYRYIDTDMV